MSIDACLSSQKMDWATPPEVVEMAARLIGRTGFDLDAAAREDNRKAPIHYGPGSSMVDGLAAAWGTGGGGKPLAVWCNPPYGRELKKWVEKAATEAREGRAVVAMLIPARTDTRYFHDRIWDAAEGGPRYGVEVHFLKGRIRFEGATASAPFPSMIVIFGRRG